MEISGASAGLSPEAVDRCLNGKLNPQEKVKLKKCGTKAWTEVYELAELLRKGEFTWEELDLDDIDVRAKWAGLFHRRKQAPGTFMMRFRVSRLRASAAFLLLTRFSSSGLREITGFQGTGRHERLAADLPSSLSSGAQWRAQRRPAARVGQVH